MRCVIALLVALSMLGSPASAARGHLGEVYSVDAGLPQWKALLLRFAERMPTRKRMIQKYLNGELPTFDQVASDAKAGWLDTVSGYLSWEHYFGKKPHKVVLEPSPELLDALWG